MSGRFGLAALWALAWAAPVPVAADDVERHRPLATGELTELRGGVQLPNGVVMSIAADLTSHVDGELALSSHLVWTGDGWAGGAPALAVPQNLEGLQGFAGRSLDGIGGSTTVAHVLRDNQVLNVVVNDALDRTVAQHLGLELRLDNYWDMREAWRNELFAIRLGDPGR